MVYLVRATPPGNGAGVFTAEAKTRRQAIAIAKHLRGQGYEVTITGPDGEPMIDETEGM